MFVLQPIEVILACSHKISRKGRYRKASERILTEKGEEKVGVTLYIKAGFRIGFFIIFYYLLPGRIWERKASGHLLFTSGEWWDWCFGVYRSFTDCSRWFAKNRKSGEEIFWSMARPRFGTVLDLFPGLLLLGISVVTEEAMGKGDGWFFLVSGLFLGFWKNVFLLTGGLFLCFPVAVWLMIGRWGKNTGIKLPLLAYLLVSGGTWGCCFCEKTGKYYSRSSLCYGGCFIFLGSAYRKMPDGSMMRQYQLWYFMRQWKNAATKGK